ncbi:hypothetical protein PSH89_07875 [Pseudomonas sp. FP1911]|uniref:hypothetical protein n=1 Tax=Pseudomonas sp. FP1911 TaxID=2954081 RepID=UPI002734E8BC|nr:hypothetical protein [Pseudomonas sp. FP1911]MBS6081808.1 hypothetical protein [Pseudomonas fluorescens]WLG81076.1 hypothetical protein PSH89_07875 [Pseudomonas sp. FP1911]
MTTDIQQVNEMEAWYALLSDAEFEAGSPEYRYETRLALADSMLECKVIDCGEWRELVEEAVAAYADDVG